MSLGNSLLCSWWMYSNSFILCEHFSVTINSHNSRPIKSMCRSCSRCSRPISRHHRYKRDGYWVGLTGIHFKDGVWVDVASSTGHEEYGKDDEEYECENGCMHNVCDVLAIQIRHFEFSERVKLSFGRSTGELASTEGQEPTSCIWAKTWTNRRWLFFKLFVLPMNYICTSHA